MHNSEHYASSVCQYYLLSSKLIYNPALSMNKLILISVTVSAVSYIYTLSRSHLNVFHI